jgi:hypothetical protein
MKRFIVRASASLFLVLGAWAPASADSSTDMNAPVPNQVAYADLAHGHWICVSFFSGGQRTDRRMPAQDGWADFNAGSIDEKFKVFSQDDDHLAVKMHRVTETNGAKAVTDQVLPIWVNEPGPGNRVKLNDGSSAVAYLIMKPAH